MIGRIISHYKILREIGAGGMGTVYLAEDVKLGRKVAMKILNKRLTKRDGDRERFKREARTAAALNHANIVTVHEIDEYEDLIYIVMEFLQGETLDKKIRVKGEDMDDKTAPLLTLTIEKIVDIVIEICKGLEIAHQAGVVHRDIKLENIMIAKDGGVKILDFGLAKLKGASKLTGDSVTLGTAFYMSPEQLMGEEFDQRIDIWSLGIMMYLMTTGEFPFPGDTPMKIIYSIMKTEPQAIVKLNRDVPPGLRGIINRCLKKNPGKRYQDISALRTDLIQVKKSLITGKSHLKWKINAAVAVFRGNFFKFTLPPTAAAFALTILLMIPSTSLKIRKFLGLDILPANKRVALLPFETKGKQTPDHRAFSSGLAENLTRKLSHLEQFDNSLLIIPSRRLKQEKVKYIQDAWQSFGVNLVISGTIFWKNDSISLAADLVETKKGRTLYCWKTTKHKSELIDLRDEVLNNMTRMLEIDLKTEKSSLLYAGCTSRPGAYEKYLKGQGYLFGFEKPGDIDLSINLFNRAIQIDTDYGLAYAALAEAYFQKYTAKKNEQWAKNTLAYCAAAREKDKHLACIFITMGKMYKKMNRFPEALRAFFQALKIDTVNGETLREIARVYEVQKNLEKAENAYIEATKKRPADFAAFNNLGFFYYQNSRWEDAVKAYEKSVKMNPDYFRGLFNLGGLYFYLKRWKDARDMLERSLLIKKTYRAYSNLGTLYYYQGLYELAVDRFKKALELSKEDFRIWGYLAESYFQIGEKEKTLSNFSTAVKMAEQKLEIKPGDADILSFLASYYARMADFPHALAILKKLTAHSIQDPKIMFRIACTFEQIGKREPAVEWLKYALDKGFSLAEIESNPELGGLRSDKRCRNFLKTIKTRGVKKR